MNYNESLQLVLDYIEVHLENEITVDELAAMLGFSSSHFQRLFQDYLKMTVAQYISRRKLLHAIYEMSQNKKSIDVAFKYGFSTYAGFYKAFKKEYGCSPRTYLQYIEVPYPQWFELKEKSYHQFSYLELKSILSHWDLPKQIKMTPVDHKRRDRWLINHEYILKYVTNLNEIEKIVELSNIFKTSDFIYPHPIPLINQNIALQQFDVYFYLERKIETSPLHLSNELSFEIGKKVATLHKLLQKENISLAVEVDFETVICGWALPQIRHHMTLWESHIPDYFYDEFLSYFKRLKGKLPYQLIHRKLSIRNLFIDTDGVVGVKNMELSERNFRLVDVCYLGTSLLAESFDELKDQWIELFSELVQGYQSEMPLTKEELDVMFYMLLAIQFIFIAYLKDRIEDRTWLLKNIEIADFIYEQREGLSKLNNIKG